MRTPCGPVLQAATSPKQSAATSNFKEVSVIVPRIFRDVPQVGLICKLLCCD
jgi:hypothetical protein